jgi:arylsulfatase A-like enzyme
LEKIPRYQNLDGRTDADFYIARYDAEIHYADAALGLFFERLKRDGRYDSSLIVVTADHGETMVEPGHKRYFSHGTIAYEEVVRIPLIVREPGGAGALARHRFDAPVKSMDIAPTALALLGVKIPREFEGRNLLKETSGRKETIFSMGAYGSDKLEKQTGTQFSLLKNGWRYIINSKDGSKELYNHESDPNESSNVISQHADRAEVLDRELRRFLAREPAESTPVGTTSEQLEQLRSLGYVQ